MVSSLKISVRLCSLEGCTGVASATVFSDLQMTLQYPPRSEMQLLGSVFFLNALWYLLSKSDTYPRMLPAAPHTVILGQEKC